MHLLRGASLLVVLCLLVIIFTITVATQQRIALAMKFNQIQSINLTQRPA